MIVTPVARETVAVAGTAVGLTSTAIKPTVKTYDVEYAEIQVQTAQVRVTFEGTAPVAATTGEVWLPGTTKRVWGIGNLLAIRFIRESSTSASLEVTYWGRKS